MNEEKPTASQNLPKWVVPVVLAIIFVPGIAWGLSHDKTKPSPVETQSTATVATPAHSKTYTDVAAWVQKYGSFVQTFKGDNDAARSASSSHDTAALEIACRKQAQDMAILQTYPDIPEQSANNAFRAFISDDTSYTTDCVNGAHDALSGEAAGDAAIISQGATEIESASKHLDDVTNDMNALNAALNVIISAN